MAGCYRTDGRHPDIYMKEQFHIVLITVGLFAAGLVAGVWTQRTRPVPPPPAPVLGEFGSLPPSGFSGFGVFARSLPEHAAVITRMNARIAELEPKIEEFQASVDAIERSFLNDLKGVLTAEQRQKLASLRSQQPGGPMILGPPPFPGPSPPLVAGFGPLPPPPLRLEMGGHPFVPPFPIGGWLLMSMIIYQPALDHLSAELHLDPAQQAAVKQLMVERRSKLLALIDRNPPPTLGFGDALPWTASVSPPAPQSQDP
jgi:hypothetical protein